MFIQDHLELETKPEDCVAIKNLLCFLFLSLLPERSSFFKKKLPYLDTAANTFNDLHYSHLVSNLQRCL